MDSVDNTTGNQTQPTLKKTLSQSDKAHLTNQQKWADSWLRRLQSLPSPIFHACVHRLSGGATAREVAAWLVTIPNRGDLKEVTSMRAMENIVQVLRKSVREAKKRQRLIGNPVTVNKLQNVVEKETQRQERGCYQRRAERTS